MMFDASALIKNIIYLNEIDGFRLQLIDFKTIKLYSAEFFLNSFDLGLGYFSNSSEYIFIAFIFDFK